MSWEKNEKKLFDFLKEVYISDLEWSEDSYGCYDCYSVEYLLDIELKCRNKHYDDLIIEKSKYDRLIKRASQYNTKPFYINETPKGVYVFNLDKTSLDWSERNLPKTSHFKERVFVPKLIGYLNVDKCHKFIDLSQ
jgi:hypothetical protein